MTATPETTTIAYVGLGSNLGDRAVLIDAALARLDAAGSGGRLRVAARSPLYETEAVAPDPQPRYLNGVARLETTLDAGALLALLLDVERALGRERPPGRTHAARTIDLDLLLFGEAVIDRPGLVVPHPRMLERAFVRRPLADVALPGLHHPVTGQALDRA